MPVPASPKIYHITSIENLAAIIAAGELVSDVIMNQKGGPAQSIGMGQIKQRRLTLPVRCHQGLQVGACVPFHFCPRSIMLYLLHKANHENLAYRGGQTPIVHLEADLGAVVSWATECGSRWAFSLSNAGAAYAEFRCDTGDLAEINWDAVAATEWSGPGVDAEISGGKQAEFLVEERFPWKLVSRIGVVSQGIYARVEEALAKTSHKPKIEIMPGWYY